MLPANWGAMTPEDRREFRLSGWASTEGKPFATPEAAALYKARAERLIKVVNLEQPDRVPALSNFGGYVAQYAGVSHAALFYDYKVAVEAMIKFHSDFDLDYQALGNFWPGPVFDMLDYKLYRWPGQALPENMPFQCIEGEYMTADEYDAFIADPETFFMKVYTPRVMGAMAGLPFIQSFITTTELPFVPLGMLPALAAPPAQQALRVLADAALAAAEYLGAVGQAGGFAMGQKGLPLNLGAFSKAPFDFIGDTMRGTRGIMLDLYRKPDKVLAAVDRLVPIAVGMGVGGATGAGNPFVFIPLHKGADGFMSNADFARFYWPTLKALLLGLIDQGCVPFLFVEGGYNQRLDIIADSGLPAGKTAWMFDQTDMATAKKKLGSFACVGGNVPASLFKAGTPQQMEDYVRKLIDDCAPGGGFFVSPGAVIDDAEAANVHAYLKAVHDYGVYR